MTPVSGYPFLDRCQLITTWMSNTEFYTDSITVCHFASVKGWTYVRTIFSEPKFLGSIHYHIFLPMVRRCARELRYKDRRNANSIFKRRSRCRPRCWVLKSLMFPVLTRQLQTVKLSFPIVMRFSLLGPMSASFRLNVTHELMIQQNLDLTKCQGTGEICSISRVRYIEHLDFKNLRKNNQNVC